MKTKKVLLKTKKVLKIEQSRKQPFRFMSVRPFAHMHHLGSLWTNFGEIWHWGRVWKSAETIHHHNWLDSPWWALAFLRSFVHSSLLRATLFQFLTSNILMSWSTPSSHRSFGLPTLLTPSGLALNIFLMVLSLFIRTRCPAHANLLTLIAETFQIWLKWSKTSSTLYEDRSTFILLAGT